MLDFARNFQKTQPSNTSNTSNSWIYVFSRKTNFSVKSFRMHQMAEKFHHFQQIQQLDWQVGQIVQHFRKNDQSFGFLIGKRTLKIKLMTLINKVRCSSFVMSGNSSQAHDNDFCMVLSTKICASVFFFVF